MIENAIRRLYDGVGITDAERRMLGIPPKKGNYYWDGDILRCQNCHEDMDSHHLPGCLPQKLKPGRCPENPPPDLKGHHDWLCGITEDLCVRCNASRKCTHKRRSYV